MPTEDSTLVRLGSGRGAAGETFLLPHHLLAANRLERLIARAQLAPRLTMSYDLSRVGGARGSGNGAGDITDSASEAR